MLQHASFDELLGAADASQWAAASLEEGWSGLLLRREAGAVEAVVLPAQPANPSGTPTNELSAVVFWFSPTTWSSPAAGGKGPGHDAHLLQWIWMDGQQAAVWWTVSVRADGRTVLIGRTQSGGIVEVLEADVSWAAGAWYCVALCMNSDRTRLMVNGEPVAEGAPLAPVDPAQCWLAVGSDWLGDGLAGGLFDEVTVLGSSQLSKRDLAADVANYWRGLASVASRGPITAAEEEATRDALSKLALEPASVPMAISMGSYTDCGIWLGIERSGDSAVKLTLHNTTAGKIYRVLSKVSLSTGSWVEETTVVGASGQDYTDENTAKESYIIFVVREDCRPSDLLFQCSVTTYQAYNPWGGNSLYPYPCIQTIPPCAGASKVSFNRPYAAPVYSGLNYATGAGEFLATINAEPYPGWEYNMVRWLERQGYDVTYTTSVDTHRHAPDDKPIKAFLSVGHDEYWSTNMRSHVEGARDRGINLGFFAANVCYWRIHFDSGETNFSVNKGWIKYDPNKDWGPASCRVGPMGEHCLPCDPCFPNVLYDPNRPTGDAPYNASTVDYWRGPNVNNPEISMIGVQYVYNSLSRDIVIPTPTPSHWAFEHTAPLLAADHHLPGLLGYEIDGYQEEPNCTGGYTPPPEILATLVTLGHSPWAVGPNDMCGQPVTKSGHSDMTIYTAASGAQVFATGSMQWNWGLDSFGFGTEPPWSPSQQSPWGPSRVHPAAQQMTHNVLRTFSGQTRVTVLFTNADTITSGDWPATYRPDAYKIASWAPDSLPSYVSSVTVQGETPETWSIQSADPRALLKPGSTTERVAAAWTTTEAHNASFTIDISLDGNTHPVAVYCVDWQGTAPLQRLEVFDSSDTSFSNPLDTCEVRLPPNGVYFVWKLSGHKIIRVTKLTATAGEMAMVSGIFFGD